MTQTWRRGALSLAKQSFALWSLRMSVSRSLYAVSAADLERVLSQPSLVLELVRSAPNSIAAKDLPRRQCDIDCAWDAIHFVLANGETDLEDFPSTFLYCGGTAVGDIDVGYGPAQAFRPADVASIADLMVIDRRGRLFHQIRSRADAGPGHI